MTASAEKGEDFDGDEGGGEQEAGGPVEGAPQLQPGARRAEQADPDGLPKQNAIGRRRFCKTLVEIARERERGAGEGQEPQREEQPARPDGGQRRVEQKEQPAPSDNGEKRGGHGEGGVPVGGGQWRIHRWYYTCLKNMATAPKIEDTSQILKRRLPAECGAVLFGSRAASRARPGAVGRI